MKVGSLVECVYEYTPEYSSKFGETLPVKGYIYTVRDMHPDFDSILLEEIINQPHQYAEAFGECYFTIDNFRELQPPMDLSEIETFQHPLTLLTQ